MSRNKINIAEDGVKRMEKFIPLSVPNLRGNEQKYVLDALQREWVSTAGDYIDRFEREIADYVNVEKAVACQSGTAGLHLALLQAGVGSDSEVIVPTLTFIAAVNPVRYLGAHPIFMDCDDNLTLDVCKLEAFIENECSLEGDKLIHKINGKVIAALVVVHVFGNAAHMEKIMDLAEKYHFKVIEDATEALGSYYTTGKYKGHFLGTIGDYGVYSFNGNKIMTTGGGGMIVAKNEKDLDKIKYLSTQAKDDTLNYIHDEIGYNYRMTNLQAALGVAQLEQLEAFIETKEKNYMCYKELLKDVKEIELLPFDATIRSNYWFYSICLKENAKITRDEMIKALAEEKIQTRPIWGLIHEQKPYINEAKYKIEKANYYQKHVINIPCSSNLSFADVERVVGAIKKILNR